MRAGSNSRGFTLMEIMVVIAMVGLLMGGATFAIRGTSKGQLRSNASKLAGGIRYCFDRAVTTGQYYRIVLDLDENKYWAERSEERMYLTRTKEESPGNGRAFDVAAAEKKAEEDEKKGLEELANRGGIAATLEPPPKPVRARFQSFKDTTLPTVKMGSRVRLFDVFTPRQREPYTKGRAYLYFFPDGHTENAVVRLTDGDTWYSLVVHPLTGRVEVRSEKVEIARDFGERDDEGHDQVPR